MKITLHNQQNKLWNFFNKNLIILSKPWSINIILFKQEIVTLTIKKLSYEISLTRT